MAIESATASVASGLWQQLQSQQAQRAADQATQEAIALQSRAREARSNADRAQRSASSLEASANQAQQKAAQISLSVRTDRTAADTNASLESFYTSLPDIVSRPPASEAVTTTPAVTVSTGSETLGTVIDTTA
jgi:hypothetical protein